MKWILTLYAVSGLVIWLLKYRDFISTQMSSVAYGTLTMLMGGWALYIAYKNRK